ncbi:MULTISPECIES: hypothetical protein [unclassified Bradyrhizobium]|uniref:hypothetical protein n=1 Tax=unclassified Bradyrhizobium TaxID=2631580 RepID=UPI002916387D|nr:MULTISPECIES: hypothetical protein [unclassified Bradyrhizobium]
MVAVDSSERASPPLSPPLASGQTMPLQPLESSESEWEQEKAIFRKQVHEKSALRFHLGLMLRRFALAVDRMADRL